MSDDLRAALHSYFEAADGGCPHDEGYGDLLGKCGDATAWIDRSLASPPHSEGPLDEAVGRVLAAYHAGRIDAEAMHDMGMAFDAKHPGYWSARLSKGAAEQEEGT